MLRKVYGKIRGLLPGSFKSQLSKVIFMMPWKPYVRKDNIDPKKKFPGQQKGGMIISADFEMAWAFRYSKKTKDYMKMGRQERENFPVILNLLEKYNIPITWATVGHLFLKDCKRGMRSGTLMFHNWIKPLSSSTRINST